MKKEIPFIKSKNLESRGVGYYPCYWRRPTTNDTLGWGNYFFPRYCVTKDVYFGVNFLGIRSLSLIVFANASAFFDALLSSLHAHKEVT